METHFNTQLTVYNSSSPRPQSDTKPGQPYQLKGESALGLSVAKSARTDIYTLGGLLTSTDSAGESVLDSYRQIRASIREQLAALKGHFGSPPEGAGADAVEANPYLDLAGPPSNSFDDLAEYWNRENTARRIFDIALMGYHEGVDRDEFADKAIAMITQAYADVRATMAFDFPQLVLDTKQSVLDALEQFRGGASPRDISY